MKDIKSILNYDFEVIDYALGLRSLEEEVKTALHQTLKKMAEAL